MSGTSFIVPEINDEMTMAKNRDKKKKEREKRVAQKKLAEAARRRAEKKDAEKKAGSVMSKNIASAAAAKTKFEESTQLPRKLGG